MGEDFAYRDADYGARVVSVIRSVLCFGRGTEEDRYRRVVEWRELDGRLILQDDPCAKIAPPVKGGETV